MDTFEDKQKKQRKYALTAGIALMVMTLAALFSYGLVLGRLVVKGDAIATFDNIKSSIVLFNTGIIGWLIILIADIVVAWSFYIFLKPLNNRLSLLGGWLRLIYAGILEIAILNLIFISILTNSPEYFSSFKINEPQSFVMLFLKAFEILWSFGLIIFGGHLMIVGYLTFKSNLVPKVISILLSILSVPMFLGELSFGIWLLFKGGKFSKGG